MLLPERLDESSAWSMGSRLYTRRKKIFTVYSTLTFIIKGTVCSTDIWCVPSYLWCCVLIILLQHRPLYTYTFKGLVLLYFLNLALTSITKTYGKYPQNYSEANLW